MKFRETRYLLVAKFDRRCCWWACGWPNSISTYNGISTFFCATDGCNGNGAQNVFGPLGRIVVPIEQRLTVDSSHFHDNYHDDSHDQFYYHGDNG